MSLYTFTVGGFEIHLLGGFVLMPVEVETNPVLRQQVREHLRKMREEQTSDARTTRHEAR